MRVIDRLWHLRDRLMASARFQRFAADFPLTRPIAQREARAAFDLCAGFVYSQVLLACVRLNLFEVLAAEPVSLDSLCSQLQLPRSSAERLLLAAVSLRLVSRRSGGRYGLGALGAAMRGNRAITDMIAHHDMLYRDLCDPVALLRGKAPATELSRYWAYAGPGQADTLTRSDVARYTQLMSSSLELIATDILDAFAFGQHKSLLDIGGGDGTFVIHAARRYPSLMPSLLDLPAVAGMATERFEAEGLGQRCKAIGGDMFTQALAPQFDLVTLVRVLLDHDDAGALRLLSQARSALSNGGTILVAEPQAGVRGSQAMGAAYFGFYLLAMGQGRARSFNEICGLLGASGFVDIRTIPTRRPELVSMIAASAPKSTPE